MPDYTDAIALIQNAQRVLLTTHIRPDGDAAGSLIAIERAINASGAAAQLLFLSSLPEPYCLGFQNPPWLLGKDITEEQITAGRLDRFDLIIVVDTSAERQLPGVADYLKKRSHGVLVLDHHQGSDPLGTCRIIDTNACAAGELAFDLYRAAGWKLDPTTATALFMAIASDTGWFRFQNTSAKALRMAGELVAAGAQSDLLYRRLYQQYPPARLRLRALAMATLELHCHDKLALMHITKAMLTESGAPRGLIENIVNEPMEIGSVEAVALLVEQDNGQTRCSLRSREIIDVNAIAQTLGGGGHARAAGLTLDLNIPQARQKIIDTISPALQSTP